MSAPAEPEDLASFLTRTKSAYLDAVRAGQADDWLVVFGNEAGDLDSVASAIGLAFERSAATGALAVPLVQTPRGDLRLRAENTAALTLGGTSEDALLCLSDLPSASLRPSPSTRVALVDHNALARSFAPARVAALVDHHADEGQHADAEPREIAVPTGSCASLVARRLERAGVPIPPGLAALLLAAVVIDTGGLKPGGKAEPADRAAAAFLAPRAAPLLAGDVPGFAAPGAVQVDVDAPHAMPGIAALNGLLQAKKADVAHLSTRDLLRRDYKEYTLAFAQASAAPVLVGLASVPVGLGAWLRAPAAAAGAFWREHEAWARERGLAALGVLTSFRDEHTTNKHGASKHRREQLWLLAPAAGPGGAPPGLAAALFEGLQASEELRLKEVGFDELTDGAVRAVGEWEDGWEARVYKQKNTDATRKATAPIVRAIVEGTRGEDSKM